MEGKQKKITNKSVNSSLKANIILKWRLFLTMPENIPTFEELKENFARVYDGASDLQREIDLVKEAQKLNIPLETHRNFYQHKTDEDIDPYPL